MKMTINIIILGLLSAMSISCVSMPKINPEGLHALNNWIQQDIQQKNSRRDMINRSTPLRRNPNYIAPQQQPQQIYLVPLNPYRSY